MLFNSWVFPVFFFIVWGLYLGLRHRYQNALLLVASYVFYGWWDWRFLSLLLISTVVDYHAARWIERFPGRKKGFLLLSLAVNLGILGFFKYFNFFADSLVRLFGFFGFEPDFATLNIILPVGISFYTFQTLAYTIDVYRGREKATNDPLAFAVYVCYFPQLVAGPIERSTHLLPEIQSPRTVGRDQVYGALPLILTGYFKKVFIADGSAPLVDQCFNNPDHYGGVALVLAVYLFAFQIYGDFSGYSDIARGISRLFGIELRLNFRQPYLAPNITEFWQRWHISLSAWLRDYLYIPLGGNRKGPARTYINNMLTMLIGGLWHGAGWKYVFWGGLHGLYLAVHKYMLGSKKITPSNGERIRANIPSYIVKTFITFNLTCLAYVFFRAGSLNLALSYLGDIVMNPWGQALEQPLLYILLYGGLVIILDILCFFPDKEVPLEKSRSPWLKGLVYGTMLLLLLTIGADDAQPFIYFQF